MIQYKSMKRAETRRSVETYTVMLALWKPIDNLPCSDNA